MNRKRHKRPILLLEVLIAFALVVLCIFPLIAPHVFILKSQYAFNRHIEMDQAASKLYTHILEKIYRQEIPWQAIENKSTFTLDDKDDSPFKGSYQFSIVRHKGNDEKPFSAQVIQLDLKLIPQEEDNDNRTTYTYQFFAARLHDT